MHALIIEDQWFVALALEEALRDIGYTSFDHADGIGSAVAAAERRCPDLILSDQQLLDGTGVQAVTAICTGRSIPVVFVTANASEVRDLLPVALVVDKPFADQSLRAAVSAARQYPFACA